MVEPLMVYPHKGQSDRYFLVDGHLRLCALNELGETTADCIIANDDESFTYNARISRIAPIQEHRMIMKAVANGVKPERIASALNIPLKDVHSSMKLLEGIHPEAVDLLKDKAISSAGIRLLKRVTGVRQIEIAELLISANSFAIAYVEALVMSTSPDQLSRPKKSKIKEGLSREDIAKMETEMQSLQQAFRASEASYGENILNLTSARGYVKKLIENARVIKFLKTNYGDIFAEFETLANAETL